jgi:hypothetical protein
MSLFSITKHGGSFPMHDMMPRGMTRRHFLEHMAGASALVIPAMAFANTLRNNADDLRSRRMSAIMLWMGGGPSTIDLWDMKPDAPTGGPFKPISTSADLQICEHLPLLARRMHHLSVVRSMSTREADHGRGRYYMHTGYVPSANIEHPGYGSVIAHELIDQRPDLQVPPFVAVGGGSVGPGFLGMTWAPFVVESNGDIRNLKMGIEPNRLMRRMEILRRMETQFIRQQRGTPPAEHAKVLDKTLNLLTSEQMRAFRVSTEPRDVQERYGLTAFGRGCLMARRLVEAGVPFIEVDMGGWDNHDNIFPTLRDEKLPVMDKAMSALIDDLEQRGLLANTAIIWMGEFGRTPRINGNAGRDHWARAWSVVLGGAGIKPGLTVGKTSSDGSMVESEPYTSEDVMATVCKSLGISLDTTFTSRSGRPMKIANGGKVIQQLLG